jgi:hypothetical protein
MADEQRTDEAPKSAKKAKGGKRTSGGGDQPIILVRVRRGAGGYEAEVRVAGDAEAVTAGEAEGFVQIEVPPEVYQEYPRFLFHADGRRKVVSNKDEAAEAEGDGYTDDPPPPAEEDTYGGEVPPPAPDAAPSMTSSRGPVPVDRA